MLDRATSHKKHRTSTVASLALALGITGMPLLSHAHDEAKFGDWSTPVNLGTPVNSEFRDGCQFLTKDGLSLYFASDRDGQNNMDLYVAERSDDDDPFGEPQHLGMVVNTDAGDDVCPALSPDGRYLYFASERPSGCGDRDIYVSRRANKHDNFSWEQPRNLGCMVNSEKRDQGPSVLRVKRKKNKRFLYFSSNRETGNPTFGGHNIYVVRLKKNGLAPASVKLVEELSSPQNDHRPFLRKDGLEVFFDSNRDGGQGGDDVWTATRSSLKEPFTNLAPVESVNTPSNEVRPVLNRDATELYFTSNRSGGLGKVDIYVSTREELDSDDDD